MLQQRNAKLILEDGTVMPGYSFGANGSAAGEVVFNTSMTGYPESLTDASYRGQILVSTYPLVGNYGVPALEMEQGLPRYFESDQVQVSGMVVSDYSFEYSHWNAVKSLSEWLIEHHVPGIFGVDTRALTKHLREQGTMLGKIVVEGQETSFYDPNDENLVAKVSPEGKKLFGNGRYRVMLIDCGVKYNIIRCLLRRDTQVICVPWNYPVNPAEYDGLFISNGPGDPKMCTDTIEKIRKAFSFGKPIFGICLGSQLMALAAGGDTYKLKYGHRSHNQPVLMAGTNRCYITSQNHGFAVDGDSLGKDWEIYFTNLNDGTCEGIRHRELPFFSCQFHPEASSGPVDTEFLFDDFVGMMGAKR